MQTYDFSRLQSKHKFTLQLKLKTPLHIGSSYDDVTDTDLPVIRTKEGVPYIPGSSIKGVIRSASEKLAHLAVDEAVCFLEKETSCTMKYKEFISKTLENQNEEEAYKRIYEKMCPTCRTFGSGAIASKIFVPNILLEDAKTMVRDGIMIDRETNVVAPTAKFDYEYVEAGREFTLIVEAENLSTENEKILGIALLQLKNNYIKLGGLQARGLGELEYIKGTVETIEFSQANKKEVLSLLLGKNTNKNEMSLEAYLEKTLIGGE